MSKDNKVLGNTVLCQVQLNSEFSIITCAKSIMIFTTEDFCIDIGISSFFSASLLL